MNATERARRSDALYRDDAKMHRRDLCDMVAQREAEIEKLRELVDYMTPIAWYAASERERARMRELGVEL